MLLKKLKKIMDSKTAMFCKPKSKLIVFYEDKTAVLKYRWRIVVPDLATELRKILTPLVYTTK